MTTFLGKMKTTEANEDMAEIQLLSHQCVDMLPRYVNALGS